MSRRLVAARSCTGRDDRVGNVFRPRFPQQPSIFMRYGRIVDYFPDKKFGFIRPDSGRDVFFHISAIDTAETAPEIKAGQPVKFELMSRAEATSSRPGELKSPATDRGQHDKPMAKVVAILDKLPGAALGKSDGSQASSRHRRARRKKPTWRK